MKIVVKEACVGCQLCAMVCPEVFRLQDDKSVCISGDIPEHLIEHVQDAKDQCPTDSIQEKK
jgi:ferredoxin